MNYTFNLNIIEEVSITQKEIIEKYWKLNSPN